MRYYKTDCGYIATTKEMSNLTEVTEKEYNGFMEIIHSKPVPPEGFDYTLNDSMEWVLYELPVNEDPDLTSNEALEIILGGEV